MEGCIGWVTSAEKDMHIGIAAITIEVYIIPQASTNGNLSIPTGKEYSKPISAIIGKMELVIKETL